MRSTLPAHDNRIRGPQGGHRCLGDRHRRHLSLGPEERL